MSTSSCVAPPPQPLVDDVAASDPEWPKLSAIPGLTEPWSDVRDKWRLATEEFKVRTPGRIRRREASDSCKATPCAGLQHWISARGLRPAA